MTLGRAITLSGAAVDPNMSFYQSSSLTAFLTIFNARLGQWMQNPRFPKWKAEGPKFGDRLVSELFGCTDDKDAYIHLSDGGHFENLGVYELIRRRCRYIIAVDAGEDTDASDDNLAQLTRLCRIDFGVRIELDTDPLEPVKPNVFSRTHVVVGRVHYEDVDSGQVPGIIVYIKISMTGDEPSDVLKYAKRDPRFPHQPTDLRQSFTDEQFESYRALGDHIARDVFSDAVRRVRDEATWNEPENLEEYIRGNQRLFSSLRSRWATATADHDAHYIQSAEEWTRFQRDIRKEPALAMLSQDLYPELPPATDDGPGQRLRIVPPTRRAARGLADDPAHGERLDQPPPQGAQRPPHGPRLDERLPPLDRHESVPPPLAHHEVGVQPRVREVLRDAAPPRHRRGPLPPLPDRGRRRGAGGQVPLRGIPARMACPGDVRDPRPCGDGRAPPGVSSSAWATPRPRTRRSGCSTRHPQGRLRPSTRRTDSPAG